MECSWVLLLLAASYGEAAVLDVFVSHSSDREESRFGDHNVSVAAPSNFSIKQIYEGPVFLLVPNHSEQSFGVNLDDMTAYYAERGLKGIVNERNFEGLHERLLNARHISSLAYAEDGPNFPNFLSAKIARMVLPDDFTVHSLVRSMERQNVHLLHVLPSNLFNSLRITGIKRIARFFMNDYSVETICSEDPTLPLTQKLSYTSTPEDEAHAVFPFVPPAPFFVDQLLYRGYRQIPSVSNKEQRNTEERLVPLSKS